ncbi:hypothetical protein E7T06_07200 [Deinococcus sp. Arct2-2]|uniref:hypothetical protein n=1 Tax=Deinococcus sp. Arct2-2 TaxID=2568653 RepID=UPI0010A4BD12|nr:hypothetical protein [Deinococcus sp. Arct2-2]THF70485.1 hypothetical protein E7T06_07200 [Deinococcus sp. Arct2-2]
MPVPAIRITDGQMYRSGQSFAWVDYPMGSSSHEIKALEEAVSNNQTVEVIGPVFTINGTVSLISLGNGAKLRVVRSE